MAKEKKEVTKEKVVKEKAEKKVSVFPYDTVKENDVVFEGKKIVAILNDGRHITKKSFVETEEGPEETEEVTLYHAKMDDKTTMHVPAEILEVYNK